MPKILEKEIVNQDCPHCKEHTSTAWVCRLETEGIIRYIYFCPNCQKPMKISNKKNNFIKTSTSAKSYSD